MLGLLRPWDTGAVGVVTWALLATSPVGAPLAVPGPRSRCYLVCGGTWDLSASPALPRRGRSTLWKMRHDRTYPGR
jgi:hypothetical protein